jgi:hypothetical protein
MKRTLLAIAAAALLAGCEDPGDLWDQIEEELDKLKGKDDPIEQPAEHPDALDLSKVDVWHGHNYAGNQVIPGALRSVTRHGNNIHIDCDRSGWPKGGLGGGMVAIGCGAYWKDGKLHAGKAEWIKYPGQPVKTLHNLHNGYNGHHWDPTSSLWWFEVTFDGSRTEAVPVR